MMEVDRSFNSTSNNSAVGSERITPTAVLGFCVFVGLPSNIAVIISIAREWNKNLSFTLKLMLNLAVSDALTLCLAPFVLAGLWFGWKLGEWSCKLMFFVGHWSLYVGVLTVTSMSVHRYHNVIKSRVTNRMILHRLERRHRHLQLTAIWILAFVFAIPVFFTQELNEVNGLQRCQRMSQRVVVAVLLLEILFGFIIPFFIMLTCYLWLHKGLMRTSQDQESRNQGTNVKTYKKRLVVSIVVAFFLFWTPVHFINVIDILTTSHTDHSQLKSFRRVFGDATKALALLNCCLDPFLYVFFSRNAILDRTLNCVFKFL